MKRMFYILAALIVACVAIPQTMSAQNLFSGTNAKLGEIKSNGDVVNERNQKIGKASGVDKKKAAYFFFVMRQR